MHVLLVEDEDGLRLGLASCLRMRGHVVHAAASCAEAVDHLRNTTYDVVVTDWRLADGGGDRVVAASDTPAVVMSGHAEHVRALADDAGSGIVAVLTKPVTPGALMREIERLAPPEADAEGPGLDELPRDARACVELAVWLCGGTDAIDLREDGDRIVLRRRLHRGEDWIPDQIGAIGGDARVLRDDDGAARLELSLFRDARPDGLCVIRADDAWPEGDDDIAVDLHGADDIPPAAARDLAIRTAAARQSGRTVHFFNTPPHLRLFLENASGDAVLPMRPKAGPRLPEVLQELWRPV